MKLKTRIRQLVSQELNVLIPEGKWAEYLDALDANGKFGRKQQLMVALVTCRQVEYLEGLIEDLYFRSEQSNAVSPKSSVEPGWTLVTASTIIRTLLESKTPETKAFYIDADDWKVLAKAATGENPGNGVGKEVDPADEKEKACLYIDNTPVFRK